MNGSFFAIIDPFLRCVYIREFYLLLLPLLVIPLVGFLLRGRARLAIADAAGDPICLDAVAIPDNCIFCDGRAAIELAGFRCCILIASADLLLVTTLPPITDLIFCWGFPTLPVALLCRSITSWRFWVLGVLIPVAFALVKIADPGDPVRTEGLLIPGVLLILAIIDPFLRCVYIHEFDTDILLSLSSVSCLV